MRLTWGEVVAGRAHLCIIVLQQLCTEACGERDTLLVLQQVLVGGVEEDGVVDVVHAHDEDSHQPHCCRLLLLATQNAGLQDDF